VQPDLVDEGRDRHTEASSQCSIFLGSIFLGSIFQGSETHKGRPKRVGHPSGVCNAFALLCRGGLGWLGKIGRRFRRRRRYIDNPPSPPGAKFHMSCDQGEQSVIATTAHAVTRVEVGAALPDDDLASIH
jgi:hypothetical protein